MGKRDQCFKPVADHIRRGKFAFVRENFPSRVKKELGVGSWELGKPRLQILLHALLRFEIVRDDDNGARRKSPVDQRCKKWLSRITNPGARQCAALLHAPQEFLHDGSSDVSEQIVPC